MKGLLSGIFILFLCSLPGRSETDTGSFSQDSYGRQPLTSDLHVFPDTLQSIPSKDLYDIIIYLDKEVKGKIALNKPLVKQRGLKVTLRKEVDSFENEEGENLYVEEIYLTPNVEWDGSKCTFRLPRFLSPGEWQLYIPEGYFEVAPEMREVDRMPFSKEKLAALSVTGAWHKGGELWKGKPMFSIHDDDGVDGKIPSCGSANSSDRNGYFTILYPLLESLGLRGCISMEGWRAGFTSDPPVLNENGRISLRLQNERGWEVQAHSMEVLGQIANNWYVDSLDSEVADRILSEAVIKGKRAETTSVYDAETGRQYFPLADRSGWEEAEQKDIKPYAFDYLTRRALLYNPDHDVDYHWGEWFRIAESLGFKGNAWVQHNAISSHEYARVICRHSQKGFSDMFEPYQYNVPPLRSTLTRMMVEGQNAPGYIGEFSKDNTADSVQYKWFREYIDRCVDDGGWIVMGLHAYRRCWKNSLPGALVSEGGTYPDAWVDPLAGMNFLSDPLTPPAKLGISEWSEWYPCPGTRLDMLWRLLKYCKERGMENVTSSEGFERMGNRSMTGYYNGGVRIGCDNSLLQDDRSIYPHYMESRTGEESYYNPLITAPISAKIKVGSSLPAPEPYLSGLDIPDEEGGIRRYYDMTGREVSPSDGNHGIYIEVCGSRVRKVVR